VILFGSVLVFVSLRATSQSNWASETPLPTGRDLARAAIVNGRLYVIGGHNASTDLGTVEAFDPTTHVWTTRASMPTPRHQMAVGVINGILYVAGGCCPVSSVLEAFDPKRNTWTTKASMAIASEPAGAVVHGILYAIGGNAGGFCTNAVQAYEPSTDTWRIVSPMPTPRCHLAAAVANGLVYAIGGTKTSGSLHLRTVEVYDPVRDLWSGAPDMPTGRCLLAAVTVDSKIYALGGNNPDKPREAIITSIPNSEIFHPGGASDLGTRTTVEVYDPLTKEWATAMPMPTARTGLAVGVLKGSLYAIGGNGAGTSLSTNETLRIP
jgi:N-acetylneuraminic acid mutarotase